MEKKTKHNFKRNFLATLSAPARRALENQGIVSEKKLSQYTKSEILKLHGMGPGSISKLEKALADKGLSFKKELFFINNYWSNLKSRVRQLNNC